MASDYSMLRAGAISALDSESKIGPLLSPLGTPRRVREGRRIAEVWICPRARLDRSEGSRPWLGPRLLAYYDPDGRLIYAGRAYKTGRILVNSRNERAKACAICKHMVLIGKCDTR